MVDAIQNIRKYAQYEHFPLYGIVNRKYSIYSTVSRCIYALASRSEEVYVTKPKAKSTENYYDVNFLTCWFPVVVPEIKDFLPDQEPPPFVFEDGGGGGGDGLRCQQFV